MTSAHYLSHIALKVLPALSLILSLSSCGNDQWIDIGVGPDESEFPYRLIEFRNKKGDMVKRTHSDLATITMDAQSGRAVGQWVYLPVYHCYAPKARDGFPSVQCDSVNGSSVDIAASDNVREILMNVKRLGKIAAVKGKIIGVYGLDTVFVATNDPDAKLPN